MVKENEVLPHSALSKAAAAAVAVQSTWFELLQISFFSSRNKCYFLNLENKELVVPMNFPPRLIEDDLKI